MDIKMIVGIGVGATAIIAGEAYSILKSRKVEKEIGEFNKTVDEAMKNIDVEIPDKLIAVAMDRAANKKAEEAASKTVSAATSVIQSSVNKVIENEKSSIESSVKNELEKQISLVDIEDIKTKVVSKASASVANDVVARMPFISSSSNDIANIIRACKEANMSTWQIEDIVKSVKEG